jgi:hypothetical protein
MNIRRNNATNRNKNKRRCASPLYSTGYPASPFSSARPQRCGHPRKSAMAPSVAPSRVYLCLALKSTGPPQQPSTWCHSPYSSATAAISSNGSKAPCQGTVRRYSKQRGTAGDCQVGRGRERAAIMATNTHARLSLRSSQ